MCVCIYVSICIGSIYIYIYTVYIYACTDKCTIHNTYIHDLITYEILLLLGTLSIWKQMNYIEFHYSCLISTCTILWIRWRILRKSLNLYWNCAVPGLLRLHLMSQVANDFVVAAKTIITFPFAESITILLKSFILVH